jgi:hypothetical protein
MHNVSLLCKWWRKLKNQDGLWQRIVKNKYLKNKSVTSVKSRASDSPCWKIILSVRETCLNGRQVVLNAGNVVRFWLDTC